MNIGHGHQFSDPTFDYCWFYRVEWTDNFTMTWAWR